MEKKHHVPEQLLLSEIQVLLAEKRTYFAILRTGLAVMTVPLTIIVFLVSTTDYHGIFNFAWLGSITVFILLAVSASGMYIFYISIKKIRELNELIRRSEHENRRVDKIIV